MNPKEIKQQVFHGGRLTCRVVNIVIVHDNGKPYSGIIRHLYGRESDAISAPSPIGLSRPASIPMTSEVADSAIVGHGLSGLGKKRDRSNSVEEIEGKPQKRKSPMPFKHDRYTFGDVFCGAGGASQGAKQAGLHVTWGLDNDEEAIRAYQLNHPGTLPFMRNAHNFPPRGFAKEDLRVCILHLSPPCCYFSPAQ
jgi:DNA (cytosine-5)-methyltransferase 1